MEKYKQILEGLLFLSGDEGLCMTQLLGVFQDELTQETLETLLDEMMKEYMEQARGFELVCYGGVYKLVSKASYIHMRKSYSLKFMWQRYRMQLWKLWPSLLTNSQLQELRLKKFVV